MGNGSNILYRIHMLRRFVALLVVLCVSFSAFASSYDNAEAILVSDIPITYGDQSFRERILERTRGERDPIGLVLTGGSARALAHLGVLSYLEDEGIVPDFIVSNSMGSIIGLLYAAGLSPDQIIEALTAGDLSSLFTFTLPVEGGLLHPSGLETLVKSVVGTDLRLEDLDIPVMVVCDDLVTKREIRICEGDFTEVLLASFALPVYFAPRIYNGHLLIDGGVISLAPVDAAFEYSDTVIVSTTFYNVSSIDLRNIISILNSSFDIGKNQKAAADMKAHEDFIWIRCDVEQFSFMDFDKMGEMAGIGYESAAEKADELAGIYKAGLPRHMLTLRRGYDSAIDTATKGLKYFGRVEAVSPSYTLGICFEQNVDRKFRRFLNNSADFAVDFDYRYYGFEAGTSLGFAFDFMTPQTAGAYPMIEGYVSYYPLDNLRIMLEASLDFGHDPWYIPELYMRQGLDWVIWATEGLFDVSFKEALEYRTDFEGLDALVFSGFFDGSLSLDWFNPDMSLGYMLVARGNWLREPRHFIDIDISARFLLPPADSLYIDARVFSRLAMRFDGQGDVPLFLSDGYTSPNVMKDAGFVTPADYHITMISLGFGYDIPYSPTFGEFVIIENSEIGIYCDLLIRDAAVSVSTGVELQTALSLIGLVDLPIRIRLGYDSWANNFAASFLLSLKY